MVNQKKASPFPHLSLAADTSGATAVAIGLSATALMGFAGLAVDASVWYSDKISAQSAADAAAMAADVDYKAQDTVSGAKTNAQAAAANYGFTNGSGGVTVTVNSPPASGNYTTNANAFEVIITKSESLMFSAFVDTSATVGARAVAAFNAGGGGGSGTTCVWAAVSASANNGATVDMSTCGIQVNGTSSSALSVVGGALIKAINVLVVGGITMNNGGSITVTGSKTTGAPAVADPYASNAAPSPGSCTTQTLPGYGSGTLNPGTFCNGLSIANGLTVTLNPGVYIIEGSGYSQQGGTTVNATGGVTLVLINSGSNYATANIANGSTLNLTAPASGATAGMAIMQDPSKNSSSINAQSNSIAGGVSLNIIGALYFPHETVNFSNGTSNTAKCTQLLANVIQFTGGAKFNSTCAGVGTSGIGAVASAPTLVE